MALKASIFYEPIEEEIIDGQRVIKKVKIISAELFEDDKEWGFCPDCEVVGALEILEDKNAELMKENAELIGEVKWLRKNQQENMKHHNKKISELSCLYLVRSQKPGMFSEKKPR